MNGGLEIDHVTSWNGPPNDLTSYKNKNKKQRKERKLWRIEGKRDSSNALYIFFSTSNMYNIISFLKRKKKMKNKKYRHIVFEIFCFLGGRFCLVNFKKKWGGWIIDSGLFHI